jgi:competence protein ComEC
VAILRDRTGDYMRDVLAANGGTATEPVLMAETQGVRCTRDLCLATIDDRWRILMTRSADLVPAGDLIAACRQADVAVSERRLPGACRPRWLKLDRETLARTGGVSVTFATGRVATVRDPGDEHPWIDPPRTGTTPIPSARSPAGQSYRRSRPDSLP